jgi:AcrR family transcriptional regulator
VAAPDTRIRIVDQGLDLISRSGLAGVTLGGLAAEVGMSKSGLFAHFKSKDAVQIALLDRMAEVANRVVVAPAMAAPAGLARLRALVGNWIGWSDRAGLSGGCPVAAALFELDDLDGAVRAKVELMEGNWRGLLRGLVGEAVGRGEFRADVDADQFVFELCGVYLTHHASHRFLRDPQADGRARIAFEALIVRAQPTPQEWATAPDQTPGETP